MGENEAAQRRNRQAIVHLFGFIIGPARTEPAASTIASDTDLPSRRLLRADISTCLIRADRRAVSVSGPRSSPSYRHGEHDARAEIAVRAKVNPPVPPTARPSSDMPPNHTGIAIGERGIEDRSRQFVRVKRHRALPRNPAGFASSCSPPESRRSKSACPGHEQVDMNASVPPAPAEKHDAEKAGFEEERRHTS